MLASATLTIDTSSWETTKPTLVAPTISKWRGLSAREEEVGFEFMQTS